MKIIIPTAFLVAIVSASPTRGQDSVEVKRLKDRIELLEAKLEIATLKIAKLEEENQRLRPGGERQPAAGGTKPTYTSRLPGRQTEVVYVLEEITRNDREVTLVVSGDIIKGAERLPLIFFSVNAVDADGRVHRSRIGANPAGPAKPLQVMLRAGAKTKFEVRFPLESTVSELQTLEVNASALERVEIKFSDLKVPSN